MSLNTLCAWAVHIEKKKKLFAHLALLSMSPQARDRETVKRERLWHFKLILMKHQMSLFLPPLKTWLVCVKLLAQPWKLAHVPKNWLPPFLASLKLQDFSLLFLWEVKKSLWWNLILFFRACWVYTVSSYPYSLRCEDEKKYRRQLEGFANSVLENDL